MSDGLHLLDDVAAEFGVDLADDPHVWHMPSWWPKFLASKCLEDPGLTLTWLDDPTA